MKYIILASSIFYLLGLKFTSNIDLNTKFQTDSVKQKKEFFHTPTVIEKKITTKDSIVTSSSGSNQLLAPYIVTKMN